MEAAINTIRCMCPPWSHDCHCYPTVSEATQKNMGRRPHLSKMTSRKQMLKQHKTKMYGYILGGNPMSHHYTFPQPFSYVFADLCSVEVVCSVIWLSCKNYVVQGAISLTISNSMEISIYWHQNFNRLIATEFCPWHDICVVVTCAKLCCDLMTMNGMSKNEIVIEFEMWVKNY